MATGDIRKCSFCLKDYEVRKNRACVQCCETCRKRHYRDKVGEVKKPEKEFTSRTTIQDRAKNIQKSHQKNISFSSVQLNWGAGKK
jgi:Fe-S-cluster-containing dehydrogenase component